MRILYLDLDTLRPDHLGCYGYTRNTSPNIDKICNEGVKFNNYYCSDAPCLPSRSALMSGRFGIHTGVVGHGGTAADRRLDGKTRGFKDLAGFENLPSFLRTQNMKTVSISPFAERHSAWWFNAGFNEMYNTGKCGDESAEEVSPVAIKWLKENAKEDNWFLQVNFWDPHTPYRAPYSFGNPFENDPLPTWITEKVFQEHLKKIGPHSAHEINMYNNKIRSEYPRYPGELKNLNDVKGMIDGYDCGIKHMDDHIGYIFKTLEEEGILEDTAIIISSDHGENMGELGIYGEHGTADNITCRIPMIVKWPGGKMNHEDNGFHYNLDLAPTLAELLGSKPAQSWDGESYASTLLEGADCGRDYLVLSQCAHVCQRSVRFDDWIYMRTYHDGFHLFQNEMLFNVKEDPFEEHNVAEKNKDVCMKAVYLLNEWHDDMMKTMDSEIDPLWTVLKEGGPYHATHQNLLSYCEHLKNTGREYGIEMLKEKHPDAFK
ncbi:sulfatase [Clostridium sediminicola]|uniref:sulfatase n=1 Tax=Clostridium sediminicola TaxID=3114879 RepID=UPI0031F22AA9